MCHCSPSPVAKSVSLMVAGPATSRGTVMGTEVPEVTGGNNSVPESVEPLIVRSTLTLLAMPAEPTAYVTSARSPAAMLRVLVSELFAPSRVISVMESAAETRKADGSRRAAAAMRWVIFMMEE